MTGLNEASQFLKPFALVVDFSQSNKASLDDGLVLFCFLFEHFRSKNYIYMMKRVDLRWNAIDNCAYIIAAFLHPGLHGKCIDITKLTLLRLTNMVYDYYGKLFADDEDYLSQLSLVRGQMARFMSCFDPFDGQLMLDFSEDPIGFWSLHKNVPSSSAISKLALKLLSIHINGAVVERAFSACGIIHDARRNRLKSTTVVKMVRVKSAISSRERSSKLHTTPISYSFLIMISWQLKKMMKQKCNLTMKKRYLLILLMRMYLRMMIPSSKCWMKGLF